MSKYPRVPGFHQGAPDTSRQAALEFADRAATLRMRCEIELRQVSMTTDECARALGESVLAVRPRFSELVAMGRIRATSERRRNASGKYAVVWEFVKPTSEGT